MTITGWGASPWGLGWGGYTAPDPSLKVLPSTEVWTLYKADAAVVGDFLDYQDVVPTGDPSQFYYGSIHLSSGGAYPATEATLVVLRRTPAQFTQEAVFKMVAPLPDRSDVPNYHIYMGGSDNAGSVAGLFFTSAGLVYTGSVHVDGVGLLHVDYPQTLIPGTAGLVQQGVLTCVRMVVDPTQEKVFIYVTPSADVATAGHALVSVQPLLRAEDAPPGTPIIDGSVVAVRGGALTPVDFEIFEYNYSDKILIPNHPPIADPGADQAVRACSILQLDGSKSYDPEGAELTTYEWRLVDGPSTSQYVFEGHDGSTVPTSPATGYTDFFASEELGVLDATAPIVPGDVLLVGKVPYTIASKQPTPFGVFVERAQIPDSYTAIGFKLLRQDGIAPGGVAPYLDTARPTFYPDKPGFYAFDLRVSDGSLWSSIDGLDRPSALVSVTTSDMAQGVVPNTDFIYGYLSNFWRLVEDKEPVSVIWSGLAQVAGAELLTLWQYDYCKSHRDIPRYFHRKWLHFDLLLGEPMPALTKVKAVAHILDSALSGAALSGLGGTRLVINSEGLAAPISLPFDVAGSIDTVLLGQNLEVLLRQADSGFGCTVLGAGATAQLRITAPVPFSISLLSTTALFTAGSKSATPAGDCTVPGPRIVHTPLELTGARLEEDDLLVIGGYATRVAQVQRTTGTTSIIVKDDLPTSLVAQPFTISGRVVSKFLNFHLGLIAAGDVVDLEVTDAAGPHLVETVARGTCPGQPTWLATDLGPILAAAKAGAGIALARVVRRSYVPVDPLVSDIPMLQERLVETDDAAIIHRNVDYYLKTFRGVPCLHFRSLVGEDVFEGERPPDRLWAESTYLDNSDIIEDNFGRPVGLLRDDLVRSNTDVDYLSAVRGMWHAYFNAPTLANLRSGLQILLGLPFAERAGVIQEIRTNLFGKQTRVLVKDADSDTVRSYSFDKRIALETSAATGTPYAVGDYIPEFGPITQGVDIVDAVKDPTWWLPYVEQGALKETDKFHKNLVRIDSRVFDGKALNLARNWLYRMRPRTELPLFLVEKDVTGPADEISVDDEVTASLTLTLDTSLGGVIASSSSIFDQHDPSGGGAQNKFDKDDSATEPTYPTSQVPVWGFDREWLVPASVVRVNSYKPALWGTNKFSVTVPVGSSVEKLLLTTTVLAGFIAAGTRVRVQLSGIPTYDAALYQLQLRKGSTVIWTLPSGSRFACATNPLVDETFTPVGLVDGDTVTLYLQRVDGAAFATPWATAAGILAWNHTSNSYLQTTTVVA